MKRLWLLICSILLVLAPLNVFASSATISVSASNTVMLGNTVTVTVKLSSSSKIGSWQGSISYDKAYLQLTKTTSESGGSGFANSSAGGTKSKSYTFTFKTLKKGSTKVSVSSYALYDYDTMDRMTANGGSTTINIKTREEIEATYSSNANLKSIKVGEYALSPTFNKETTEYNVEVPNEIETVNVSASKEDGSASVTGTGEITLMEGNNKVSIVVTAQKGNTKTYVVNIYRKELDPINITVKGKDYTIIRKSDALPEYLTFAPTTTVMEDTEVPALYSETTGYTLIGLKNGDSEVEMYIVEDGKVTSKYVEVKSNAMTLYPLDLPDNDLFKDYIKKEIDVDGIKVSGYLLTDDSKYAVIYAQDINTGDTNYYSYNIKDKTAQVFDKELIENYEKKMTNYKYVFLGLIGVIVILLFILIVRKPKVKKNKKVKSQDTELVKKVEEHIDNEIKDELKAIKLSDDFHKTTNLEEENKSDLEEQKEEQKVLSRKEQKRLKKQEKKKDDFNL